MRKGTRKKKIFIVAMASSIHVVRWIDMLVNSGWEIHVFNSIPYAGPHPELQGVIYYDYFNNRKKGYPGAIEYRTLSNRKIFLDGFFANWLGKGARFLGLQKSYQQYFNQLVQEIKPDVIHSMESQHAGYIVNRYFLTAGANDKTWWMHSTWGLDIDYYQYFPDHAAKLREMFSRIDLFISEGQRDIGYARGLGFTGEFVIFPCVAGGYKTEKYKHTKPPSQRKKILVKGYQDSTRRGLYALTALVKCKELLQQYDVVVFSPMNEVRDYVNYINAKEGLDIKIYRDGSYDQWIGSLAETRVLITNNLSDGNPSTLFECMLMGVFPIQSITSCADEWIENGKTGFLVQPENIEEIANSIRGALTDDHLVDQAVSQNHEKVVTQMSFDYIQARALEMYSGVLAGKFSHGTYQSFESKIA